MVNFSLNFFIIEPPPTVYNLLQMQILKWLIKTRNREGKWKTNFNMPLSVSVSVCLFVVEVGG
jgi:hypothetical protein